MTGKQLRKKLKVLFKELNLDDKEIELTTVGWFLSVGDTNLKKLYDEIEDRNEIDRIWDRRTKYRFKISDDEQSIYVETVSYDKNRIAEA